MMEIRIQIKTNNQIRHLLDWEDLSQKEKSEFDYIENPELDGLGRFVRYRGIVYDISEFVVPSHNKLKEWDGVNNDTFFSGTLFKFADENCDCVIMGQFFL